MAEGVFRAMAEREGLEAEVDSAATGDWHTGDPPYPPAITAAAARGYDIANQRARQVRRGDFDRFDHVLAMDGSNYDKLSALCPMDAKADLRMLMEYAPETDRDTVPDPYYTGDFEEALDLIEAGVEGLLAELQR